MSDFTKMDFSRETSTREVFENAHLENFTVQFELFLPIFWQVLQETAGRSGRRTGRKGSRNHQIYHPPWQWHHNSLVEMLAKGTVPHPQTLRTFMLSTLEVSHRNPMATPWPGLQISAMLFFVEHSCSVYNSEMSWWQNSRHAHSCSKILGHICVVLSLSSMGVLCAKKHAVVAQCNASCKDFCKSKKEVPINLWVLPYYLVFNVDQLSLTERFVAPLIGRNNMSPSSRPKTGVQWWQKDVSHQSLLRS